MGRGCERGGDQTRRGKRGVSGTKKRYTEWNRMAPRGQGAVAAPISTGFKCSDHDNVVGAFHYVSIEPRSVETWVYLKCKKGKQVDSWKIRKASLGWKVRPNLGVAHPIGPNKEGKKRKAGIPCWIFNS